MSDVEMDTSPRSNSTSDSEKPPTPGYENQDGDEHDDDFEPEEAVENDEKERESVQSKSPSGSVHDESDEEADDRSVSHKGSLSGGEEDEGAAAVGQSDLSGKGPSSPSPGSSPKDESGENEKSSDVEKEGDIEENPGEPDDMDLSDDAEENEKEDIYNIDVSDQASESGETKEAVPGGTKEEESINKNLPEKEPLSRDDSGGGHVDDGDLLQISDLSVDLTGDEAAIVEDILQSAGDGELIPSGTTSEETPHVDIKDEKSDSLEEKSPKSAKERNDEQEEQVGGTGELLADIFGSSDEDEEFEGFEQEELQRSTKSRKKTSKEKREKKPVIESDEEDEDEPPKTKTESQVEDETPKESLVVPPPAPEDSESEDEERQSEIFVSDFEQMMQQKKEENRKINRRRKNVDIINDNDDLVAILIQRMQEAAQEDRLANEAKQAATKKLVLLPTVLKHMLKIDLMVTFVDSNVLPVLKDWLVPLPDGSLPHLQIREGILKILTQLPAMDSGALKVSGIGKAIMYLFRHPKETRKNKQCAGKLISEWSRPIFGVTANFKSMSREEREERDYANMSKRRRLSSDGAEGGKTPKRIENAINSGSKALRPGDKGWCMRARVPAASNKDYVVRPKSNIEFVDFSKSPKKSLNRFEQQKRKFNDKKSNSAKQRAVEISLEGRKMAL